MTERKNSKGGLGRGLSALMSDVRIEPSDQQASPQSAPAVQVPIERIVPNPDQPRRSFPGEALRELSESIRQKGVIQPLIVRPKGAAGSYEIVAGERRWRAAQLAQLHELPVVVRQFSDEEMLEVALIENIQREDLNPIEEALAYRQLMQRFGHTQEKLAEALSRSRSHIANLVRLLALPDDVQEMVKNGKLSAGHARALVSMPNALELALKIVGKGLTVRQTEDLVRKVGVGGRSKATGRARQEKDPDTKALEQDLTANLQMPVSIDHDRSGLGGVLSISYRTLDQLDLLCRALSLAQRDL